MYFKSYRTQIGVLTNGTTIKKPAFRRDKNFHWDPRPRPIFTNPCESAIVGADAFHLAQTLLAPVLYVHASQGRLCRACFRVWNAWPVKFFAQIPWPRPIFANPCGSAIVGANVFHFPVRNGKGWFHIASETKGSQRKIFTGGSGSSISLPRPKVSTQNL